MFNSSQSLGLPSLTQFFRSIFSYNGSVLVAALISLLLVLIFVLLLHLYAKWFLAQARHRRRSSITVSQVLAQPRFHHFHSLTFDRAPTLSAGSSPTKGLDPSLISTIPLFVYTSENRCGIGLECVICLSAFEDNEIGRSLPKCKHMFHVECIDMWLSSHSNCPICRASIGREKAVCDENALRIVIDGQRC